MRAASMLRWAVGSRHVVMSIRRMSLGAGYRYLMASVARSDLDRGASKLTGYYAETGTPPGRFLGAGLAGLADGNGIPAGTLVSETALFRMLGMLQDPITTQPLGRAASASSVAGFDLTFSVPKSVSVAWALADPATRRLIEAAHHQALLEVISYGELQVFASRTGRNGINREPVRGVVAAGFDHWDSRAGDPQLHTHVVVLNRAQAVSDGQWRTLDSKAIFKAAVAMSELYNGLLADRLTDALGWGWEPIARAHSTHPKWEVTGVPGTLTREFSQRSVAIQASKEELIDRFTQAHHRPPTSAEVLKLRQQATLETRDSKTLHSLDELTRKWTERAATITAASPELTASLAGRNEIPARRAADFPPDMASRLARTTLSEVADKRATFTRGNVLAETHRQLSGIRFATAQDRITAADAITAAALTVALPIGPPPLEAAFADRILYTTREILDAETRMLEAGRDTAASVAATPERDAKATSLSSDQAAAVEQIAGSGRRLDVLVGAAGTGKTTTMSALRQTWEATHGPGSVIGLAPSATAAEVLATELGIPAANTAKWLAEHTRNPDRQARIDLLQSMKRDFQHPVQHRRIDQVINQRQTDLDRWTLRPGQLVILDEASLAGTITLDRIADQAKEAGSKILLVGDSAQLDSVTAGGAFHLLASDRSNPPTLNEVRRFDAGWEKAASLRLRDGDHDAIKAYRAQNRLHSGASDGLLEQLHQAWQQDVKRGLRSLMIAADHDSVRHLNDLAHDQLAMEGRVTGPTVTTRSNTSIAVGDTVITRRNDRTLTAGGGWVKNGDSWRVTAIRDRGEVIVQRANGVDQVRLPADYAAEHLDLGYAITVHQAQGRTVDTAHAYVTDRAHRELLYVMSTRARQANHLYVDTSTDAGDQHQPEATTPADDVLRRILDNPGRSISATEAIRAVEREAPIVATAARPIDHPRLDGQQHQLSI